MTKPRNSVLYMFDPLQQPPSTPPRGSSPELSQSDKENDAPPGDFTVFFNRFYVAHKEQHPRPLTPKGTLIDIGDTPVLERVWDPTDHDGSDADEDLSESDVEACGVVSPPTMPLADLDLDHTPPRPPIPQAVPALRIFKKTLKTSRSTDLTSKTGTEKLGTSLKRIASLSTVAAKPAVAPTQPARAPIRGVQRPPASMRAAGDVVIGLPPRSSASVAGTASSTCTSSLGTNMEVRSARAPVSRFAGIQRPNVAAGEKAAPRSTRGGLRFAAPGSVRPPASSAPKAGGAALRHCCAQLELELERVAKARAEVWPIWHREDSKHDRNF